MNTLRRSWQIFVISFRLINREKKLLIFPLISALTLAVLLGILWLGLPEIVDAVTAENGDPNSWSSLGQEFGIGVALYLGFMLLSNFCNVAFFSEIFQGLQGGKVSIWRGLKFACRRLPAIFWWSLMAAVVGVVLAMAEKRAKFLGKIVYRLLGSVWNIACCFVIPVMVFHNHLQNPLTILRYSSRTIRETWGEALTGFLGIYALSAIPIISGIVFLVVCEQFQLPIPCAWRIYLGIPIIALIVLWSVLVYVAQQVYTGALYLYAQDEYIEEFDEDYLRCAFVRE